MPLLPQIAKHLPEKLSRFCDGLRYPHAFLVSVPLFIVCLLFSRQIPYPEQVLTAMGVAMFFLSKARWS